MDTDQERLKEILAEAIARTEPSARAAYLEGACAGDAALRSKVEALIAAYEKQGDFVERTMAVPGLVQEGPGTIIGRYKLLQEIGEGGFGVVYMAEQKEPVHRKVALKIIKAGMDTREVVARFEAERQALALMDHPHIAQVFDGGVTQAGRPYFVMELVKGVPITDYCDFHNLPMSDRLQLFMQVCHAVQHAHQKGIIHRDLKPSNILITMIDSQPVPKIIDFGVAKALGQQLTEKTLFTALQQIVGTPLYMSPEQTAMSGVDVDTRSDIYSLGVLLYELLTGCTPIDAETVRKAGLDEVRRMIRETEPPKPSTRLRSLGEKLTEVAHRRHVDPSALTRQMHGDLDWIIMKALEKDRARRYETASALVEDIQRHLDHQPVMAGAPGVTYRAKKYVRRHRMGVALAASVTVALIVGLIFAFIGFMEAKQERDRAVVAEGQAEQQRDHALAAESEAQEERDRALVAEQLAEQQRNQAELFAAEAALAKGQKKLKAGDSWGLFDLVEAYKLAQHNLTFQATIGRRWSTWHAYWDHRTIAVRPILGWPSSDHLQYASNLSEDPTGRTKHAVYVYDTLSRVQIAGPLEHDSIVIGCAFSPDGHRLATLTEEGMIHLWDAKTGVPLRPPCPTKVPGLSVLTFSPCGRYLAAHSREGYMPNPNIALVSLERPLGPPSILNNHALVREVHFSPNGEMLVAESEIPTHMWRTSDLQPLLEPQLAGVSCMGPFSPDGTQIAFFSRSSPGLGVLDVRTHQVIRTLPLRKRSLYGETFSHNGRWLACYGSSDVRTDATVEIWGTHSDLKPHAVRQLEGSSGSPVFSPDDSMLAASTVEGRILVLRTIDGEIADEFDFHRSPRMGFLSNGVFAVISDGMVRFLDLETTPLTGRPLPHDALVYSLAFDTTGKVLAVGSDGELRLWLMRPSLNLAQIVSLPGRVRALRFSEREEQFVAFTDDGTTTLVNPVTGTTTVRSNCGRGYGFSASLAPDRRKLALFKYSELVFVDTKTGLGESWPTADKGFRSVAFNTHATEILIGWSGWFTGHYDATSLTLLRKKRVLGWANAVAVSPGEDLVAVGVGELGIRLYDSATLRDIGALRRASAPVQQLRFSGDGTLLASAGSAPSGGAIVELWHVDSQLGLIPSGVRLAHSHPVWSLAFSPDNTMLVTGGEGTTRLWHLPSVPKDFETVQSRTQATLGFRFNEKGQPVPSYPPPDRAEEIRARLTQDPESSDTPLDAALKLPPSEALTAVQELADQHPGITLYQQLLGHLQADVARSLAKLAIALRAQGKLDEMQKVCRELAACNDAGALNNLAWRFATLPDPNQCDGQWAVKLAEQAVAASGRTNAMYLDTLAAAYAEVGQFTHAVRVQKQAIALLEEPKMKKGCESRLRLYESGIPYHDHGGLARQAHDLLDAGKFAEAEPLARECLALREKLIPNNWRTFNARSMLGGSLLGQKKYAEAEPLLLFGYEAIKQRKASIPAQVRTLRPGEALQRLVQLYDATDRPAQAAEWKQKLAEFEQAETLGKPATPPK